MTRERISLVPEEDKENLILEAKIQSGEINPENFKKLSSEKKDKVYDILFKIASSKVEPNKGASVLEFVLFGFMRVMIKKIHNMSLTADERKIEESLKKIMEMHQITNTKIKKEDWLFDYMQYAENKAAEILRNREKHIENKKKITGKA